jgi:hypothetical protein
MLAFRSVVSRAGEVHSEEFLYELKAGPAGGLRPGGRRCPSCRCTALTLPPSRMSSALRPRGLVPTPGVVVRTRPPDRAAGLRADGQPQA